MRNLNSPLSPDIWLADLFTSKAVQQGGVIRRQARDIERFAGMDRFMVEIRRPRLSGRRELGADHHFLQPRPDPPANHRPTGRPAYLNGKRTRNLFKFSLPPIPRAAITFGII